MSEIITTGTSLLITITTIIIAKIKGSKSSKEKTEAEKKVEITKIIQKLPFYIMESEEIFGAGTGKAKKQYVLNYIQIDCIKACIEYVEENWETEIEKILLTPQKKEKKNGEQN